MPDVRDVPQDNPAGRLHSLLKEAHRTTQGKKFGAVWAEVFGVDPDDHGRVLELLAETILEVNRGKAAIRDNSEINEDYFLPAFTEVEKAFNLINFGTAWKTWWGRLQDDTLTKLAYTAKELSRVQPEGTIPEEDLEKLRAELDKLLSTVLDADIDETLKQILVEGVEQLRRAIIEYKIRGADGLREALERNYGMLYLHRKDLEKEEEARKTGEEIFETLQHVQTVLNVIWTARRLTPPPVVEAVAGFLSSGVN